MHIRRLPRLSFLVGTALSLASGAAYAGGGTSPAYSLTVLAPLPGTNDSVASGVNDSGQVVGTSTAADDTQHAFFYSSGTMTDLGTLPGTTQSDAFKINDLGQVAGYSTASGDVQQAFLSGPNGGALQGLGTLGGSYSLGFGVNATGQVAGVSSTTDNAAQHAFLTGPQGVGLTDLGALNGGFSQGNAVNAAGQVAGDSGFGTVSGFVSQEVHPFFYSSGVLSDLGTFGGSNGSTSGINAAGQVAGDADLAGDQTFHAFLSAANGGALQDLGTLGGADSSGRGVNDAGQVVGGSQTTFGAEHAYLFSNGGMVDLNSLVAPMPGFTLTEATGISDTGFIVGYSTSQSTGLREGFLLTPHAPVPEASSVVSLGALLLGGGGLLLHRRRNSVAE